MHDWEIIASRDPFFGVISTEELRASRINADARRRFYASGEDDIARVLAWFDVDFGRRPAEGQVLDIGCGVGRLSYALAKVMPRAFGYDVSESMIRIAREAAPANLDLTTQLPSGPFAWINSYIVFQHIPPQEGLALLEACLDRAEPSAFISAQITAWREGAPPSRTLLERFKHWRSLRTHRQKGRTIDPLIQMYEYNFSDVLRTIMSRGFSRVVLHHTGHGIHHGAWILALRD
jgi:SAM-dependent methyltransferase